MNSETPNPDSTPLEVKDADAAVSCDEADIASRESQVPPSDDLSYADAIAEQENPEAIL